MDAQAALHVDVVLMWLYRIHSTLPLPSHQTIANVFSSTLANFISFFVILPLLHSCLQRWKKSFASVSLRSPMSCREGHTLLQECIHDIDGIVHTTNLLVDADLPLRIIFLK